MTDPQDAAALRVAYDGALRLQDEHRLPAGASIEHDGPLQRCLGFDGGGVILYRDLAGLEGDELDALIARQIAVFAARGEPFEWKLHGHDQPPDLAARLRAAGLVAQARETVLIAPVEVATGEPRLPAGVTLREVHARADLDRIASHESAIWGHDQPWLADALEAEYAIDAAALSIFVAEAGDELVSAGWVRFADGTPFATLWGGATLDAWRGRGIYRALVRHRANLAAARGFGYLQVDASDNSRPILERLGFVAVAGTVPFIWSPAGH